MGLRTLGQIRLGESISSEGGGQNPLVAVPVALVAGVVAVAKATPLLLVSPVQECEGVCACWWWCEWAAEWVWGWAVS